MKFLPKKKKKFKTVNSITLPLSFDNFPISLSINFPVQKSIKEKFQAPNYIVIFNSYLPSNK